MSDLPWGSPLMQSARRARAVVRPRAARIVTCVPQVPTPRMLEFAALVSVGLSNKAIAKVLGIELGSVKKLAYDTFKRLRVRSRLQVALYYRGRFQEQQEVSTSAAHGAVRTSLFE